MVEKDKSVFSSLSVAPMMGVTHYWGRRFLRLFNDDVTIYGEMIPARALLHMADQRRKMQYLQYDGAVAPVVFQLGTGDVKEAMVAAEMVVAAGFRSININCGCPAKSVKAGDFGAILMNKPAQVALLMANLTKNFPTVQWSVKCRIGVDGRGDDEFLDDFVSRIIDVAPVKHFQIHARKAFLKGLDPRANRTVPPLDYPRVYRLKKKFPHLHITINGGIKTMDDIKQQLLHCDGVMLGRAVVANPFLLFDDAMTKKEFYQKKLLPFLDEFDEADVPTSAMLPFLMAMIRDDHGAKKRRTELSRLVMTARKVSGKKLPLGQGFAMVTDMAIDNIPTDDQWLMVG